jgi:hypothetical protein
MPKKKISKKKNSNKKEAQIIHIKLEHSEAIDSKRDVLISEMNILKLKKIIQKYSELRNKELDTKIEILNKIKICKKNLAKLEKLMPSLKVPEILKDSYSKKITQEETSEPKRRLTPKNTSLESELEDIQRRLQSLQ